VPARVLDANFIDAEIVRTVLYLYD